MVWFTYFFLNHVGDKTSSLHLTLFSTALSCKEMKLNATPFQNIVLSSHHLYNLPDMKTKTNRYNFNRSISSIFFFFSLVMRLNSTRKGSSFKSRPTMYFIQGSKLEISKIISICKYEKKKGVPMYLYFFSIIFACLNWK